MLKSASLVAFCFLLGAVSAGTVQAHRIITTPLLPAVTEAQIDARSVCTLAGSVRSVPDCQAFKWTKSVSFSLDTSPAEAATVCGTVASKTSGFAGKGWSIRIYSPFATSPIATCLLR